MNILSSRYSLKMANHAFLSALGLCLIHSTAQAETASSTQIQNSTTSAPVSKNTASISTSPNRCTKNVAAAGKATLPHQPDWGVFGKNNGFGAVGGYTWFSFGPYAPYAQARWVEDWSDLCNNPKMNEDWFNRLKYIRLNDSGSIWLSLSGGERLRYVFDSKPYMGFSPKSDSHRLLLRSLYGADLHLGEHVRAYAELINGVAGGSNMFGYQTGFQRQRLELQQGFLELKQEILGAKMGVMGGRQFFVDTPPSMTSPRELTNIRQSWDGFRGYAFWKRFRIDLFDLWQTDYSKDRVFHAGPSYNARMYGGLASYALPSFMVMGKPSQTFVDAFFIGYLYNGGNASLPTALLNGRQQGSTRRDNIGGRTYGNLGDFNFDITGIYQGGEFRPAKQPGGSRPVRAYAFDSILSYNFKNVPGNLSVGLQSDYFSGGNYNKNHGAVRNYAAPYFTTANYQDMTLSLATSNSISTGPLITYNPTPKALLKLHAPVVWRASTKDTVYGVGFNYPMRGNFSGGFVGSVPQVTLAYAIAPHLVLTNDFAGFLPSTSLKKAGAKNGAFVMETLDFRF